MTPTLDHVILAVRDLEAVAVELRDELGLEARRGGRHPGWGTGNRIVSLGPATYLEVVAVHDARAASATPFGRLVQEASKDGHGLAAWAVAVSEDELEAHAARLGLEITRHERPRPAGGMLRWRLAGLERAIAEPLLPFFLAWDDPDVHPARDAAPPAGSLKRLELSGDAAALAAWLGPNDLPVRVSPGPPAVSRVVLRTRYGEHTLP